jgi:hydroxymethylpyrimidine/phosphomethylpyrimidine kinase
LKNKQYKRVLTIAGSDSGGGAGIQADLKTFAALGCYGTTAITAVTVQNTQGVSGIYPVPENMVKEQIKAVLTDIGTDAVKIGMLHSVAIIKAVADALIAFEPKNIVLDPVMVATSGDKLIADNTIATLKSILIPLTNILTPNIHEAEILCGKKIGSLEDMKQAAAILAENNKQAVLIKGSHLGGDTLYDVFYQHGKGQPLVIKNPLIQTKNTHGTGCTLSSAIAAFLAQGYEQNDAVKKGINYVHQAIEKGKAYQTGKGNGPVNHLYEWRFVVD